MPHQCTACGHVFPDGSKEMLSGCPDCGGNKFQFKPGSVEEASAEDTGRSAGGPADRDATSGDVTIEADRDTPPEPDHDPAPGTGRDAEVTVATDPSPTDASAADASAADPDAAASTDTPPSNAAEDDAQASARSEVVSSDELSVTSNPDAAAPSSREDASTPSRASEAAEDADVGTDSDAADATDHPDTRTGTDDDRAGLDALREELNDQFESIRIVSPGQYELNLMELYDRQEYIISLQEDGRYVIEMPGDWGPDED
ncbi:hypothetical protein GWK26_14130 [haloarchaeon 3A1-DGR]|nr:hypothetical protein GWK26_14130 [haloarchaeon 3A1-DGR]